MRYSKRPIEAWLADLHSPDAEVRWEAVDAIRHVMSFEEMLPVLLRVATEDDDFRCRGLALHGLKDHLENERMAGDVERPDHELLAKERRTLTALLQDADPRIREDAAVLLGFVDGKAS